MMYCIFSGQWGLFNCSEACDIHRGIENRAVCNVVKLSDSPGPDGWVELNVVLETFYLNQVLLAGRFNSSTFKIYKC